MLHTHPHHDREQWWMTGARRLTPGDIFALPGDPNPLHNQLALTQPIHIDDTNPYRTTVTLHFIDLTTGATHTTTLPATASLPFRRDAYYTPSN